MISPKQVIQMSFFSLATCSFMTKCVFAQNFNQDPASLADFANVIDSALSLILPISFVVALLMGAVGAFMWLFIAGDPNRLKLASGTLTWAMIGLITIGSVWALSTYIIGFILSL